MDVNSDYHVDGILLLWIHINANVKNNADAESAKYCDQVEGTKWKWRYEYPANADGHVHKLGGAYTKPKQRDGEVIEEGTMGKSALYVPVRSQILS